jgi:hypothetical protein
VMALSLLPTENSTMLIRVTCPCGHAGVVAAESLPRDLVCSACGSSRHVHTKDCARIRNEIAFEEWLFGASGAPRVTERKL